MKGLGIEKDGDGIGTREGWKRVDGKGETGNWEGRGRERENKGELVYPNVEL